MNVLVTESCNTKKMVRKKNKYNLRYLRVSLKYRPEILKLVLKMRQCIKKKSLLLKKLKQQVNLMKGASNSIETSTQTDNIATDNIAIISQENEENTNSLSNVNLTEDSTSPNDFEIDDRQTSEISFKDIAIQTENTSEPLKIHEKHASTKEATIAVMDLSKESAGWKISKDNDEGKSIAEQVKEAAQSAIQQTGMVYVESAGMYYDYKTGYYYNSELGLYYHTDTSCYYYFNDEKKQFVFHSYPDRRAQTVNPSLEAHEKRKARKSKQATKTDEDIDNLMKNLSKDIEDAPSKPKRKKISNKKKTAEKDAAKTVNKDATKAPNKDPIEVENKDVAIDENKDAAKAENMDVTITENINATKVKTIEGTTAENKDTVSNQLKETGISSENEEVVDNVKEKGKVVENVSDKGELEDGECSDTSSEKSDEEDESDASTETLSDDDAVAKHHPPCMRVIVRDTKLPKLKVGTLFLITKDGGSVGREGDQHAILLRDANVSRNHLDIRYDVEKKMYVATDLGSKNGTLLNGLQMSGSQITSPPMEVIHGSTIQLGETKLLCHIHPGNDTCGHCEPGLLMESQEKEKAAYTRTCSVQKQHQLELARLKNKYAPEPLMIEEGAYNDRAKARRETVGSSHSAEKTQSTDVDTFITPENKGFKLLEKMGWNKGEGLGKDNQGDTEPVPLVSNEGKAGLGTAGSIAAPPLFPVPKVRNTLGPATLRLATKSKLLQPPAKVFQDPLDDDSE